MTDESIKLSLSGAVATIQFNRPEKKNAVSQDMWRDLPKLVHAAEGAPEVGAIVIKGAGGCFASGADVSEFDEIYATLEGARSYANIADAAIEALAACRKPTIAMIEGPCMGGGCLIAIACDLRYAASTARFSLPVARLGLMFAPSHLKRIVDAIGSPAARDLVLTARAVGAEEALRIGLINDLFDPAELECATLCRVSEIVRNSRWSNETNKAIIKDVLDGTGKGTEATRDWLSEALAGKDFAEGLAAFRERRRPVFGALDHNH